MTRRERLERKIERRRDWAAGRRQDAARRLTTARTMAGAIPFGQPILIGHHSERRDRNYRERIRGNFEKAFESHQMADHHASKAAGLSAQLETSIYSDDHDAIDRLKERIATLEAERDRIKAINAAIRRHGFEAVAAGNHLAPAMTDAERNELVTLIRIAPYHQAETRGFPAYQLQNLGGNINRQKKRLELLSGNATRPAAPVTGDTATARAGLVVTAGMTTPSRPGKQPRPVWTVTGNLAEWRPLMMQLGGTWYRGAFSFYDDPSADIETACSEAEQPATETKE